MNINNMLHALEQIYENRYGGKWMFTAQRRGEDENVENSKHYRSADNGGTDNALPA